MIKFYRNKTKLGDREILKAAKLDDNGNVIEVVGIIGKVKDLKEAKIIFVDGKADGKKWLAVTIKGGEKVKEAESKKEAAEIIREWFDN